MNPTAKIVKHCEVMEGKGSSSLNVIKIMFQYDVDDIAKIKTLIGRRYNPDMRCWTAPMTPENIQKLKVWGFAMTGELDIIHRQSIPTHKDYISNLKIRPIPGLKGTLLPYQAIGVAYFDLKDGRALNADEMGLGKTIQTLAWLQLHPEYRPVIIVVPSSLKLNWLQEAFAWMTVKKDEVMCVYGQKPYSTGKATIIIINYDIVSFWLPALLTKGFKVCVLDEIHSIKNSSTKRTKAVKKLSKGIPHVIGLSGTPIVNRPIEAYNALTIINSAVIPNFKEYTRLFCDPKFNGFGITYNGASNTLQLHQLLINTFMIRRLKVDVLKELPEQRTCFVPIQIDNEAEYRDAENNFIDFLKRTKGLQAAEKAGNAEALTQINTLSQLAIKGKMSGVIDWITEFIESGEKLVVFATHIHTINMLMEAFPHIAVRYDGTVNQTNRNKNVQDFQTNSNIKLFFGMLDKEGKPAGVGITLTAAWSTATVEYQWGPTVHDQADARIHRIGQKNACINYKLMAANTIDEKFAKFIDSKRKTIDSIMDGKVTEEKHLLTELMNSYL